MKYQLWDEWARDLGFNNEAEAMRCLYGEWSMEAIADLFGVAESTIHYRIHRLGIKPRARKFSKALIKKRGNPISEVKAIGIKRRYKMLDRQVSWAELGRQFGVNEITAKKYATK